MLESGTMITKLLYFYAELEKIVENEKIKKWEAIIQSKWVRRNTCNELVFPAEDTAKYTFFQKIVMAVQNWFTLFGWSKGPNPISIPYTLRR